MKSRIIALLLLVVTLTCTLVGCAYSYRDDDMSKYVEFNKDGFDAALKDGSILIKDADFTSDEDIRDLKILDKIYADLLKKADTDATLTEGEIGKYDQLAYCYYATAIIGEKELVFFANKMNTSSADKIQLSLSTNEDLKKLVSEKLVGLNIKDYAYSIKSSGAIAEEDIGKEAYISYVVETTGTSGDAETKETTTYTYKKVIIGDAADPIGALLKKDVAIGAELASTDLEGIPEGYSKVKVNWVVEKGQAIEIKDVVTYTDSHSESAVSVKGTSEKHELKDVKLNYYIYPVNYVDVMDLSAAAVLEELLSSYSSESTDENGEPKTTYTLPVFENHTELIKAIEELKTKLTEAETATSDAEEDRDKAQDALDAANELDDDGKPATDTTSKLNAVEQATKELSDKEAALKTAEEAEATAKKNFSDKCKELITAATEKTIVDEYKYTVKLSFLATYNSEIKESLAKAVWELLQKNATVTIDNLPRDAVQSVFDRLMSKYETEFNTGTWQEADSSKGLAEISYYAHYNGNFEEYLSEKMKTYQNGMSMGEAFTNAKHAIWKEAQEYVLPIVTIYRVAEIYGLELTDAEIDEYKNGYLYIIYSNYYEQNSINQDFEVATQFDKIMNHFLKSEEIKDDKDNVIDYDYEIEFGFEKD